MHAYVHTYKHIYTYMFIHACIHTYIHCMDLKVYKNKNKVCNINRHAKYKTDMQNVQNYWNTDTINTAYTLLWIILIHKISSV